MKWKYWRHLCTCLARCTLTVLVVGLKDPTASVSVLRAKCGCRSTSLCPRLS